MCTIGSNPILRRERIRGSVAIYRIAKAPNFRSKAFVEVGLDRINLALVINGGICPQVHLRFEQQELQIPTASQDSRLLFGVWLRFIRAWFVEEQLV